MPEPTLHRPESTARLLGEGELAAVPTLEVASQCAKADVERLAQTVWASMAQHELLAADAADFTFISPGEVASRATLDTSPGVLGQYQRRFAQATRRAIRPMPVTLHVARRSPSPADLAFTETARLTLGTNFFPDDAAQVSISVTSSRPDAWEVLTAFRDDLLPALGCAFCWSTLGHGFVCDLDRYVQATKAMEHLCMRHLGVDLQDPFGGHVTTQHQGPRSINWQVCANPDWLDRRTGIGGAMARAARPYHGALLWQADAAASLCDRNDPADHPSLARYAALDRLLAPLLYVPRLPWFPGWDELTTERWAGRWQEVQH